MNIRELLAKGYTVDQIAQMAQNEANKIVEESNKNAAIEQARKQMTEAVYAYLASLGIEVNSITDADKERLNSELKSFEASVARISQLQESQRDSLTEFVRALR